MAVTRRKFLKHLAFAVGAAAIAPAALAKAAIITPANTPEWVWIDVIKPLQATAIEGDSVLQGVEEDLSFSRIRVNPLVHGKMGQYEGVTLHKHQGDRRLNRN